MHLGVSSSRFDDYFVGEFAHSARCLTATAALSCATRRMLYMSPSHRHSSAGGGFWPVQCSFWCLKGGAAANGPTCGLNRSPRPPLIAPLVLLKPDRRHKLRHKPTGWLFRRRVRHAGILGVYNVHSSPPALARVNNLKGGGRVSALNAAPPGIASEALPVAAGRRTAFQARQGVQCSEKSSVNPYNWQAGARWWVPHNRRHTEALERVYRCRHDAGWSWSSHRRRRQASAEP